MKNFLLLFLFSSVAMTAQIELVKNKFYCNGNKVSLYDLTCIMENDTQAFDLIKKADSNNFYGICYMAVGGGFLGYSIHDVLKEKEHVGCLQAWVVVCWL